jgi:hypothetical protein
VQTEQQSECYQELVTLNEKPISKLSSSQQSKLFDAHKELALGRDIKDIIEELVIIRKVYDEQLKLLDPLRSLQLKDFHFRRGDMDADGHFLLLTQPLGGPVNGDDSGQGNAVSEDGSEEASRERWDERDWYRRTSKYMELHREEIDNMTAEAKHAYEDVSWQFSFSHFPCCLPQDLAPPLV